MRSPCAPRGSDATPCRSSTRWPSVERIWWTSTTLSCARWPDGGWVNTPSTSACEPQHRGSSAHQASCSAPSTGAPAVPQAVAQALPVGAVTDRIQMQHPLHDGLVSGRRGAEPVRARSFDEPRQLGLGLGRTTQVGERGRCSRPAAPRERRARGRMRPMPPGNRLSETEYRV